MMGMGIQKGCKALRAFLPLFFLVLCVLVETSARADLQPDPGYALTCPAVGEIASPFPADLPTPSSSETARVGAAAGSFSVTPTGEAAYTIPLVVPPGRAELEPHLAVSYNSAAGEGLLGVGFSLSGLSAVTRCPRTLAQDGYVRGVRYDDGDALCLDGRRLVAVDEPAPDVIEYRTFPDTFVKVLAYEAATGPTHFEVRTKSGLVLDYGITSDSQVLAKGGVVRSWWLAKTSDVRGNSVVYSYHNNTDPSEGYTRLHAPQKIEYTDSSRSVEFDYFADTNRVLYDEGMKLWSPNHLWHVRMRGPGGALVREYRFEYERNFTTDRARLAAVHECAGDNASDNASNCKPATYFSWKGSNGPGFSRIKTSVPVPTNERASAMTLDVTGDGLDDLVIPDLDPIYGQNPGSSVITDWQVATDLGTDPYFQDLKVEYEQTHEDLSSGVDVLPELGSAIDYDHDGRTDIFLHDIYGRYATWHVLLSRPGLGFQMADTGITRAYPISVSPPIMIKHPEASAHLADVDGDGMSDLIQCSFSGLDYAWTLHRWTPSGFDPTPEPIGALFLHPCNATFFTVDLDGDGKVELLVHDILLAGGGGPPTEGANYIALREEQPGMWSSEDTLLPKLPVEGRLIFLDVNGDGLSDALESGFSDHQLRIWLNTGDGFDGPYDALASPVTDADKFINLATPIDDNGDGRQDLLIPFQEAGNVTPIWMILRSDGNTINGTFAPYDAGIPFDATLTTAGIGLSHPHAPRVSDVDGDGKQDVILALGATFSVFKSKLGEEDLLATITTGLNAHHAFSSTPDPGYVPDVAINYGHLIDDNASYLVRDAGDDCAYPRHCVAGSRSVVTGYSLNNGADGEREFAIDYRNGRYDRLNRSFLGFGERIVRDLITGASTTERYDTSTYDTNLGVYPLAGSLLEAWRSTPLNSAQTALVHSENFYQVVPTKGGATFFTLPVILHETRKENTATLSASHRVISQYDEYGNVLEESNSTDGVDLTNHVTRVFWNDPSTWVIGRLTSETQCSGAAGLVHCRTKSLTYNLFAEVKTEGISSDDGDPDTILSVGFERDAFGNITRTTATDAIGHLRSSCTSYDAEGVFPFAHRNAAGHLSFAKFHPGHGVPLTIVDPNGHATQWALDGFGRVVKEVRPDGTTSTVERTWTQEGGKYVLKQTTRSDGFGEKTVLVDGLGRPIKWWRDAPAVACAGCNAGEKIVEAIDFDPLGEHVARRWKPARESTQGSVEEYEYDAIGRLKTHTTPWGAVTSYSYSGLTTQINHPGLPPSFTVVESDALGRPISVAKNIGIVTSYEYGPFGALRSVTDPGGATTTIERDALGRVTLVDDPDRGTTFVYHNGFGEQRLSIDALGRQIELEHDALGRLSKRTDSDGITSWAWDVATKGIGELAASVSAGGATTSYIYDTLSRPAATILSIGSESFEIGVGYDGFGRVDTITYPEGFAVKQEHDASGKLVAVRDQATNDPYWQLAEVDAAGRTTREIFGNGVETERSYFDDRDRVERIHTWKGAVDLQDLRYAYDERQNLTSRIDERPNGTAEIFAYDVLDRIVCAALDDPQNCQTTYSYLTNGNIASKSDVGTYSYDPGHPHAVQTAGPYGYGYDAVGNQITRPGVSVAYTAFDLPHHFYAGTSVLSLAYDADQRRIRKTTPTEETTYVGDLYERVVELGTGEVEHRFHIHGPERPVAVVKRPEGGTPTTRYMHVDHLGSTDVLSDEAGGEAERRSYDAFGARRNPVWGQPQQGAFSSQTKQGFTGHEGDDELGLINMRGRLYDPQLGRFLTPDPFVANPLDGQSFNAYSYVLNNPLAYVDPSGFTPEPPVDPEYLNDPEVQRIIASGCKGLECSRAPPAAGDASAEAAKSGAQKSPIDVGTTGQGPEPPPTPKAEDAELSPQDKIVAAGVGGFETYARMLEEYQRDTLLNVATLGSYGLIKGGYGFYSSAYANMKRDGIVVGAINTINPLYHLAVLGADIKIAADNGDWKGVGGAVTKAGVAVVGMIVGAKAAGGAARGGGMLRRTSNSSAFSDLAVPMQMRSVKIAARQGGIGLNGVKVQIVRDPSLVGRGVYGYTAPRGTTIQLYPDAFGSMESLVKTLGHERTHIMQIKLYGAPTTAAELAANEAAAYAVEESFWHFFLGGY